MDRVNEELKDRYVEASVNSEAVEVTFNGQQELVKISLNAGAFEKDENGEIDVEMLEDLIVAAVNQGIEKSKQLMNDEMSEATGGMSDGLPGFF